MTHQKVRAWGWSLAELHLHLGETQVRGRRGNLIFLDERESVGLLGKLSAVGAEPSAVRLASMLNVPERKNNGWRR